MAAPEQYDAVVIGAGQAGTPLARVGLSEGQARAGARHSRGDHADEVTSRAREVDESRGFMKAVVDAQSK